MTMRRKIIPHTVAILSYFIFTCASYAASYLSKDAIDPNLLTPPYKVHSLEWDADISTIVALQKNPGKAELEEARAERDLTVEMTSQAVEPLLTRTHYPAVYTLLDNVRDTSKAVTDTAKKYWNTRRPYIESKDVKALIDAHDNPAYPSGHTSGAYTQAHVLGLLIPEKRNAFRARAESIARHRILVGMHYPQDVAGGKELALLIIGALIENADFKHDLERARQEIHAKAK